jgi:5'-phosphate synthase pdxT subunit
MAGEQSGGRTLVGVLALQGDFREHREALEREGALVREVRTVPDLDGVRGLVLPGGESTAIGRLLRSSGLFDAIRSRVQEGTLPLFGTCAGMIIAARTVIDGVEGQPCLGAFDAQVRRNAIGRQRASFEADIVIEGLDPPFRGVFIRPPGVESAADAVTVLAEYGGRPVLCTQGPHLFSTFHPELTGDGRLHRLFLERL